MTNNLFDHTFVIKMAISSDNERELLHFLSTAVDDEDRTFSFENLIAMKSDVTTATDAPNPIHSLIKWRLDNWGVAHNCDTITKDVKHVDELFRHSNKKYTEYLQFTSLFNIPIKLFLELSNHYR